MIFNKNKTRFVSCGVIVAAALMGCSRKKDTETVYVQVPPTAAEPVPGQPVPAPAPAPTGPQGNDTAPPSRSDALAVTVSNRSVIENQELPVGPVRIEFGLAGTQGGIDGLVYKCKLEQISNKNTNVFEECQTPKTYQILQEGTYAVTIFAVHTPTNIQGEPTQIEFSVGQSGGGSGGGFSGQPNCIPTSAYPCAPGNGLGGFQDELLSQQVGDMLSVNIPQGFHMVHRTSTFDNPGYLNFQFINGGRSRDRAAPFTYTCNESANFETLEQLVMPSGRTLDYCNITPSISWNSPADPIFNSFRWLNMSTLSYNSISLASDESLIGLNNAAQNQPVLGKLSVNVFSNLQGTNATNFETQFATELNQTVSRMNVACAGQVPQYLGNAAVFQDYFQWSPVATPLFGCTTLRNNKYFVQVGAFPLEQNVSILPGAGWAPWIRQSFSNVRAAEIVVEIGPFAYAPSPLSVAQDAQALMVQNIKKLLPTVSPIPAPIDTRPDCGNRCGRRPFWRR
jgi:hypothetical protein